MLLGGVAIDDRLVWRVATIVDRPLASKLDQALAPARTSLTIEGRASFCRQDDCYWAEIAPFLKTRRFGYPAWIVPSPMKAIVLRPWPLPWTPPAYPPPAYPPPAYPRPVDQAGSSSSARGWSLVLGVAASLGMVGAGLYMVFSESASEESTVFDVFFHGIGIYFIARGIWVLSTLIHRNQAT